MKISISSALMFGLFLGAAFGAGCSSDAAGSGGKDPIAGDAFLTIVGESNVFAGNGAQQAITVRYHDSADEPLAGAIDFAIRGAAGGATLSGASAVTDRDGKATITLTTGTSGDAAFTVEASAELAQAASWRVAVTHNEPTGPLDPSGRFTIKSQFDMVSNLPGTVGQVVNTFVDMTDSPNDPATWILDQTVAGISNSTIRTLVSAARPALDGIVNNALLSASPTLVTDLLQASRDLGTIARKFGTESTLEITGSGTTFTSTHTLTHFVFSLGGQTFAFPLAQIGLTNQVASNVTFALGGSGTDIGSHQFPLSYGSLLMVGLEDVVIPAICPEAHDLETFMTHMIDCDAVGAAIAGYVGFGGASLYRGVCQTGLTVGSNLITSRIRGLDTTAMMMKIGGHARAMDTNTDRKIDTLQDGAWTGSMTYGTTPVTLGASTFRGDRVTN